MLQYQTLDALNSDFDSLEFGLEKRFSNRWSGRVAYTLAKSNDVAPQAPTLDARVSNDLESADGLRPLEHRQPARVRHRASTSTPFGGLSVGAIFRYYSGYPINETIGTDVNGDRDNNDRPVRGVHDADAADRVASSTPTAAPSVTGSTANSTKLLDLQVQYIVQPARAPRRSASSGRRTTR